jgi:hypothetical protein
MKDEVYRRDRKGDKWNEGKEGRKEGVSPPNVGYVNHSWNSINRYIEIHTFFRLRDLS